MQIDALFRDVASRVADMCVNPETNRPYPLSTIERAMRETLHFAPLATKSAKMQALQVVKQLEASSVLPIARAKMHLRIQIASEHYDGVMHALRALGGETAATSSGGGTATSTQEQRLLIGAAERLGGGMSAVPCHADPVLYRPLAELAKEMGGSLQVRRLSQHPLSRERLPS